MPSMLMASASLTSVPTTSPSHVPKPTRAAVAIGRRAISSPTTAREKWPQQQADEPEPDERSDQAADDAANQRLAAGAEPSGAEYTGNQIRHQRQARQHSEHSQRRPADMLEVIDPRSQPHACIDQQRAGQAR